MNSYNDLIFYHIYPLGFCDALYKNNYQEYGNNRLNQITEYAAHVELMGCNAVYIGPVFESTLHGYDTIDYYYIDRRLGNNEQFKILVEEYHKKGIKVIVDTVFNHVGRDFWAFQDVLRNRENSKYKDWFVGLNFNSNNCYGDNLSYQGWHNYYDLVKLNLENPNVKEHLFNAAKMWIEYFNIDGLRIDAADCMNLNFLNELSLLTKGLKRDFFIVGEVVPGDYRTFINMGGMDSVTNYECYKGLYSSHNDINFFEIAYSLNRQFAWNGIYNGLPLYNFVDNHDVNRIGSILKKYTDIYTVYGLLFTMPGIPSIYYGSEYGINGEKSNKSDNDLRPSLSGIIQQTKDEEIFKAIKKLINIRKNSSALRNGSYLQIYLTHQQIGFIREDEKEIVVILVNSADRSVELKIEHEFGNKTEFVDLLNNYEKIFTDGKTLYIKNLYPNWLRILCYKK